MMKTMTKQQELKERIYKHCPELKELTMGCRVLISHPEYRNLIVDTINQEIKHTVEMARQSKMPDYFGDCYFVTRGYASSRPEKLLGRRGLENIFIIEVILGHPIHLEHVLRAIGDRQDRCTFSDGSFSVFNIITGTWNKYGKYDLTKTFDQNITDNAELLEFLLEVIK